MHSVKKIILGLLVVSLNGFAAEEKSNVATITAIQGPVQIFSNPSKEIKGPPPHALFEGENYSVKEAAVGAKVENGTIVRTAPGAQAKIIYDNGDQISVGPASAYRIFWEAKKEQGGQSFMKLLYGKIRNTVSKSGPRNNMEIRSGSTVMGIRGTDFYVSARGTNGKVEVTTLRGNVSVAKAENVEDLNKPAPAKVTAVAEVKSGFTATVAAPPVEKLKTSPANAVAAEVTKTTKEELTEIVQATTVEAKPVESMKKLEEKAVETTLTDIKTYDPKLYEELKKKPISELSVAALNTSVVDKIEKTAPHSKKSKKPTESELDDSYDSYERYFKKVD